MNATIAIAHGPRFWLPLLVAVSIGTFLAGVATGSSLSRGIGDESLPGRTDVAGRSTVSTAATRVSDVARADSLTGAQWDALYGPTAATWGVWKISPHSLTGAQWDALYGPTAATWGIW